VGRNALNRMLTQPACGFVLNRRQQDEASFTPTFFCWSFCSSFLFLLNEKESVILLFWNFVTAPFSRCMRSRGVVEISRACGSLEFLALSRGKAPGLTNTLLWSSVLTHFIRKLNSTISDNSCNKLLKNLRLYDPRVYLVEYLLLVFSLLHFILEFTLFAVI